ncbi:MAG: Flp pilus assembly complex ATPase component TadA [Verrucomicrobia bacterium]|nr:Flp pilus assembly complex ATPase component TadA [Verrucomicrobiota bacterium]
MKRQPSGPSVPSAPEHLERLVRAAERAGASDIHLHMVGKRAEVAFRLDGVMTPAQRISEDLAGRVFGRIKYLARLKTYQESLPQDGRIDRADLGARNDLRVATYPTVTGEKIVLRLFHESSVRSLAELGLPEPACAELERCLRRPSGLILLTGPAGSGKTTTIHAGLSYMAGLGGRHIITVEDPVEHIIPGTMQTEVNEAQGLTFAKAARHLMRQDPQVLAIGEIRDEETAGLVVRAASTGHLVLSTLHAGSCQGVFERLSILCPDTPAVLSALELILNQRLVRRLCPDCGGRGCDACLQTGYRGRVPLVEWFRLDPPARQQIRAQGAAAVRPVQTLADAAAALVKAGVTNAAECERVLGE